MKNSLFIFSLILSCGTAYALPQDWPCFGIEVERYKVIKDTEDNYEYSYKGEKNGYFLDIDLSGYHSLPSSFADCGNYGCFGTITEKATGRTESLRFFCEEYNDDYTKVTCYAGFGEEAVFHNIGNGNYILNYCLNDKQKTLRFNLSDCDKCHCIMHWYNGEVKNRTGEYSMACKKEDHQAHCFSYYAYEAWKEFHNNEDDYKNCVGLDFY